MTPRIAGDKGPLLEVCKGRHLDTVDVWDSAI